MYAFRSEIVPLGYHEYNWVERTGANTITASFRGTNGDEAGFYGCMNA
jgi:hypothetical protein